VSDTLLIGYDGSDDAGEAIVRAAELFPGAPAVVVHVWEPLKEVAAVPPVPGLYGLLEAGLTELDETGAEVSQRTAEEGAERAKAAGLAAEPLSLRAPGRAWRNIMKVADEHDVRVIVVGRRGVGRAERALLGSVSTALVHNADRPVVVVPPADD